jgi:hypothetical protein
MTSSPDAVVIDSICRASTRQRRRAAAARPSEHVRDRADRRQCLRCTAVTEAGADAVLVKGEFVDVLSTPCRGESGVS